MTNYVSLKRLSLLPSVILALLTLVLFQSCGDKAKHITPDKKNDIVYDARKQVPVTERRTDDPCSYQKENWSDLGLVCHSGYLQGTKGKIAYQRWTASAETEASMPAETKRGTLFIVTGRTEFTEKYAHVAKQMALDAQKLSAQFGPRFFDIVVYDHYGQGRSEGIGGDGDLDTYLGDLSLVVKQFANVSNDNIMLGHSMGGMIATHYMLGQKKLQKQYQVPFKIKSFIFSAPMYMINTHTVDYRKAYFLIKNKYESQAYLERFPYNHMLAVTMSKTQKLDAASASAYTDDFAFAHPFITNPLMKIGDPTYRWLHMALIESPMRIFDFSLSADGKTPNTWYNPQNMYQSPFMLIHSAADKVVNNSFFNQLFYHELQRRLGTMLANNPNADLQEVLDNAMLDNKKQQPATVALCHLLNNFNQKVLKNPAAFGPCFEDYENNIFDLGFLKDLGPDFAHEYEQSLLPAHPMGHDTFTNKNRDAEIFKIMMFAFSTLSML